VAINYLAKLAESTSHSDPNAVALTAGCPAGSLVLVALAAKRSGAIPGIVSLVDSKGNSYTVVTSASLSLSVASVGYCRTPVAMVAGDTITVDWNGAVTDAWLSAHAFENAAATAYDTSTGTGFTTAAQLTLDVSGSDWLTFACFYFMTDASMTVTPVNSSISRDSTTNQAAECFSRNGSGGTTHVIGGTTAASESVAGAGASFLFESSGDPGNLRGQKTLIGV
jgi:hypothetical protein